MVATKENPVYFADLPVPDILELEKIGEGKYREVYRWENFAVKVLKPHIKKQFGPITIHIPTKMHSRLNCGIEDFNEHEFQNYCALIQKIPERYHTAFNSIHAHGAIGKRSISLSDIVHNSDGTRARSLFCTGSVNDPKFWRAIHELHDLMITQGIYLLDVRAQNILVRDNRPVLFDYKRLGATTYPLQPWLQLDGHKIDRIKRRLDRLESTYRNN